VESIIVRQHVTLADVAAHARDSYGDFVKAVVDIQRQLMAMGGEMHADDEALLIDDGSGQSDLWGINLYPEEHGSDGFIEYDSMINLRPRQGNRTTGVDDRATREKIAAVVARLVQP